MSGSGLRLKVSVDGSETRRFALDAPVTFDRLQTLIGSLLQVPSFTVQYTDDEGELVTIASDADLKEAVTLMEEMNQKALKITVNTKQKKVQFSPPKPKFEAPVAEPAVVVEEKVDAKENAAETPEEEKAKFDAALAYVVGQFASLDPLAMQPEILNLVILFQQASQRVEAGDVVQWDSLIQQVSAHAPVIASLPCFHDEHQRLFDSLEIIAKFFVNRVESGLLYTIPSHLAPLMFFKSEKVLKGFAKIQGVPLQLQVILESLSAVVGKLETLHAESESDASDEKVDPKMHTGVQCDNCGAVPIIGNRYKCTACHNFDLCEACESSGVHPTEHELIKFKVAFVRNGHRFGGPFGVPAGAHQAPFGGQGFGGACGGRGRRWKNSQCPWNKKQEQPKNEPSPAPAPAPARVSVDPLKEGRGAEFIRDVNIEDKVQLGRGQMHVKTWSVRNDGKVDWDNSVKLVYVSGNREILLDGQEQYDVPMLKSGETGDISVPFVVPGNQGTYRTVFRLVSNGEQFGHHIWVEFISK